MSNLSAIKRCTTFVCLLVWLTTLVAQHPPAHAPVADSWSQASFSENKGQWDDNILYQLRFNNGKLFLEKNAFTFAFVDPHQLEETLSHPHENGQTVQDKIMRGESIYFDSHAFRIRFKGANPEPGTQGTSPFSHYENYYLDNDPSKWASNVGVYNGVGYTELYPGIDMNIKGHNQTLKYEFIVQPNADPNQVMMQFEGVDNLYLKDGQLHYQTSVTHIYDTAPYAYQVIDGQKRQVACEFVLRKDEVSFWFPNGYDRNYPLVIDPTLIFSSYTGSTTDNWGYTATYDQDGNLYAGGVVFRGLGYPTTVGAYQTFFAGGNPGPFTQSFACDIGLSKFTADGSNLLFSTYLGGAGNEAPHSLVVNNQNELLVYGATGSSNFPLVSPVQNTFSGGTLYTNTYVIEFNNGSDIYISKFNAAGSALQGSTYAGGTGNDGLNTSVTLVNNYADQARGEIIVDDQDFIFVTSSTQSTNFPVTAGAAQATNRGGQDACLLKYTSNLQTLVFATYIGGTQDDAGYAMQVAPNDEIFVCGGTQSANLPGMGSGLNGSYLGGSSDGYIIRVNSTGTAFQTGTYIGTNFYDQAYKIQLDANEDLYVYGQTLGAYPVTAGVYSNPNGKQYIHKLNRNLNTTRFSTVFGSGSAGVDISPTALLVDICDNIYISGWGGEVNVGFRNDGTLGFTTGMPVTPDAYKATTDGSDFYFMVLSKDADSLVYATFFGGNGPNGEHVDGGTSRFDSDGIIYQAVCASCGGTSIFPTTPGVWAPVSGQNLPGGNCNLGVIKFEFELARIDVDVVISPSDRGCVPYTVNFSGDVLNANAFFWDFGNGFTSTAQNPTAIFVDTGTYNIILIGFDSTTCSGITLIDTAYATIIVGDDSVSAAFTPTILSDCGTYEVQFTNNTSTNGAGPLSYLWNFGDGDTSSLVNPTHTYSNAGTYVVQLVSFDLNACDPFDVATDTLTFLPTQSLLFNPSDTSGCTPLNVLFNNNSQSTISQTVVWQFGDGTQTTTTTIGQDPTHLYTNAGVYTVTVTATSPGSCNPVLVDSVDIAVAPLDSVFAGFVVTIVDSCDYTISITDTSTGALFRKYFFGTGDTSTLANPNYIFPGPGNYTITQIVNNGNCSNSDTARITINFLPRLVAAFAAPDTGCLPLNAVFVNNSNGSAFATYAWSFGDTATSTQANPTYTYNNVGSYNVNLVVTDPRSCNGTDTATTTITVINDSIIVDFTYQEFIRTCDSLVIIFSNTSTNATSFFWDFGDGTTSTLANPTHAYTTADTFVVTFTAANPNVCNQPDTLNATFIQKPEVTALFDPTNGCVSYEYLVENLGTNVTSSYWQLSNGQSSTDNSPLFVFDSIGSFTLNLTNYNPESCNDSAEYSGTFNVYTPPTAFFETDTSGYQIFYPIQFDNQSSSGFYSWVFGDGDSSAQRNPLHEYTDTGFVSPCVTVTDNNQCTDTYCKELEIYFLGVVDVPNAFSPNGDGMNDILYVRGYGVETMEFKVFNRWGELVFESYDINDGWDGSYKSKAQEMEVYVYTLQARFLDGTETGIRKGNVTLLR